jgi:GTPase
MALKFCDFAKIHAESGAGGHGCVSFRREKNIPFGGPDGGHGGNGGSVLVRASRGLVTLIDFRYRPHYKAKNGQPGQGRNKAGLAGPDLVLKVPIGTEIWVDGEKMVDLVQDDQELFLLRGGLGGRGNASFASSTNRAPRESTPGEPGQQMQMELRLKLLADVGFIGLPNAGKSTLLRALTNACPKVGPYPFTTLVPQLGTMITPYYHEIILADLPGLVEGAHEGKGLGHRFLGHGERCKTILHILDGTQPDPQAAYHSVRQELLAYNPGFADKAETLIITKTDMMDQETYAKVQALFPEAILVSAHSGHHIQILKDLLCHQFFPQHCPAPTIAQQA